MRARARPFRRVLRRFSAASVRSAQRHRYLVLRHVRYLGRAGAHNLQRFRCPQSVPNFPAPTSAPGSLWTTKPPPEARNCVPRSLTYLPDAVVTERRRLAGDRAPDCCLQIIRSKSRGTWQKRIQRQFRWEEELATLSPGTRVPGGLYAPRGVLGTGAFHSPDAVQRPAIQIAPTKMY